MTEEEKGSYEYRLKLENDRERSHRESEQGMFSASMLSLDDSSMRGTIDENSSSWQSDHGRAARRICRENTKDILAEAMKLLIKHDDQISMEENEPKRARERAKDIAFIKAVLEHKSWADLGITKRGFNKRLAKIISFLVPTSPQKGRYQM